MKPLLSHMYTINNQKVKVEEKTKQRLSHTPPRATHTHTQVFEMRRLSFTDITEPPPPHPPPLPSVGAQQHPWVPRCGVKRHLGHVSGHPLHGCHVVSFQRVKQP